MLNRSVVSCSCACSLLAGAFALSSATVTFASKPVSNIEGRVPPALNAPQPAPTDGPVVQLALLLDTSNSMDGLIDQARAQLWSVVNEMSAMQQDCEPVQLQVALFQYGNDGLEGADGYIELRTPFTTDLDILSEQLFSLRTNGGSEFCGQVIQQAADGLGWIEPNNDPDAPTITRMIVIAGNEPFTQGTTPYQSAIPSATNKGIAVHTVFCGPKQEGINTFWRDGATLGEGRYCAIDHNKSVVEIETPYDKVISRLNVDLNATYIRFGAEGEIYERRQALQDSVNYDSAPSMAASRTNAKASGLYNNRLWDLVDASKEADFDLDSIERDSLPEHLQGLTSDELQKAIDTASVTRVQIQTEIKKSYAERKKYIAEHQGEKNAKGTLEAVLLDAINEAMTSDDSGDSEPADH